MKWGDRDRSGLLSQLADLLERLDAEFLADLSELFGADIPDDVDEDGFLVGFEDGDDDAFDGFLAALFEVDTDFLAFFLDGDDAFPALGFEFGADLGEAFAEFGAIGVIDADDIDADGLEATEKVGDFGFLFLGESDGEADEVGFDVDLDELAAAGGWGECSEVDKAGGEVFGAEWGGEDGQGESGGREEACECLHGET